MVLVRTSNQCAAIAYLHQWNLMSPEPAVEEYAVGTSLRVGVAYGTAPRTLCQ